MSCLPLGFLSLAAVHDSTKIDMINDAIRNIFFMFSVFFFSFSFTFLFLFVQRYVIFDVSNKFFKN